MQKDLRIGALAATTGVSCDTLRFYEKRGLIRSVRSDNGYRSYAPETAQLVAYIRTAQKLGFSLAEIGGSLPALWNAADPDQAVAAVLSEKLKAIDLRIEELQRLRSELEQRVRMVCPLTASSEVQQT